MATVCLSSRWLPMMMRVGIKFLIPASPLGPRTLLQYDTKVAARI